MEKHSSVTSSFQKNLLKLAIFLLLTLILTSFTNAQFLFKNQAASLDGNISETEPKISAAEAYAATSEAAQDSLPGSFLFQFYGKEAFFPDYSEQSPPSQWPHPTGKSIEWMTVYISEDLTTAMLFFVSGDGSFTTQKMDLSEIPPDELPPVPVNTLPGLPADFVNSTVALDTAIARGMAQYIETARAWSGYEISYAATPFWFEYPEYLSAGSDPFWEIELEYGNWNHILGRYEYTIVVALVNAIDGNFIALTAEEHYYEPEPLELLGTLPINGSHSVALNTLISFDFNTAVSVYDFHYYPSFPSIFFGVFPRDAIQVGELVLSEDHKTVRYPVNHEPDTDYTWIFVATSGSNGGVLTRPEVLTYSTRNSISNLEVSGTVSFKNSPHMHKKEGINALIGEASTAAIDTENLFNRTIVALIDSRDLPDEFYGNLNELNIRYAAVPHPQTGEYTIPYVADGEYVVGAVMYDVMYGYPYMLARGLHSEDDEPTVITVSGSSLSGIDLTMKGYIPELVPKACAQTYHAVATDYMANHEIDGVLLAVGGYEYLMHTHWHKLIPASRKTPASISADTEPFPSGRLSEWWFIYFHENEDEDMIHLINVYDGEVVDHESHLVSELDEEDLPEIPLTEMRPIPSTYVNSTDVAATLRSHMLDGIIANSGDYMWVDIDYELGDFWFEHQDLTDSDTGLFWVVDVYISYMNLFETFIYHDFTFLIHAETGAIIGERLETEIDKPDEIPVNLTLTQNFPNPFNPSTTLRFELPETSETRLQIFDVTGRLIATVIDEIRHAGVHEISFNAGTLSSGVYIYRLEASGQTLTRKMTLIK